MTKEQLRAYNAIGKELLQIQHKLERLETALYNPKISRMNNTPSAPPVENVIENMVANREELQEKYNTLLRDLTVEQLAIEKAIESSDPSTRTLLRYRYIDGLKWEEICVRMNYSWRQVHRLHARALDSLKES